MSVDHHTERMIKKALNQFERIKKAFEESDESTLTFVYGSKVNKEVLAELEGFLSDEKFSVEKEIRLQCTHKECDDCEEGCICDDPDLECECGKKYCSHKTGSGDYRNGRHDSECYQTVYTITE